MSEMEHMKMRWIPKLGYDGRWEIVTVGPLSYYIALIIRNLYGDPTGELTCRAICDEHNRALELTEIKEGGR